MDSDDPGIEGSDILPAVEIDDVKLDEVEIVESSVSEAEENEEEIPPIPNVEYVLRFGNWSALHILFLTSTISMSILTFIFYFFNHHFSPTFYSEYYKAIFGYFVVYSILQSNYYPMPLNPPSWKGLYKYPVCTVLAVVTFFLNRLVFEFLELITPETSLHFLWIIYGFYFGAFDYKYFDGGISFFLGRNWYKGPFWIAVSTVVTYITYGIFGGYSKDPDGFQALYYFMYLSVLQFVIIVGLSGYVFCFKDLILIIPWKSRYLKGILLLIIQWMSAIFISLLFYALSFLGWPDVEAVSNLDRFHHILYIGTYPLVPSVTLGLYTSFFKNLHVPTVVKGLMRLFLIVSGSVFAYFFNHLFLYNMLEIFGDHHWVHQYDLDMNFLIAIFPLSLFWFCGGVWYRIPKEERDNYHKMFNIPRRIVPRFGWWTAVIAFVTSMIISVGLTVIFFYNLSYEDFRFIVLPCAGYFFMFSVLHSIFWTDHVGINMIGALRQLVNVWMSIALFYFNQAIFDALDYSQVASQFHHLLVVGFVTRLSLLDVASKGAITGFVFVKYRHFKPLVWYFFGFAFSFFPILMLSITKEESGLTLKPFKEPIGYIILCLIMGSTPVALFVMRGIGPIVMARKENLWIKVILGVIALLVGIVVSSVTYICVSIILYFFEATFSQRGWHAFNVISYLLPAYIVVLYYTNKFKRIICLPSVTKDNVHFRPIFNFYELMPKLERKAIDDAKGKWKEMYRKFMKVYDTYWPIHAVTEIVLLFIVPILIATLFYFIIHLTILQSRSETVGIGKGDWWESNDAIFNFIAAGLMFGHFHYTNGFYFFTEQTN